MYVDLHRYIPEGVIFFFFCALTAPTPSMLQFFYHLAEARSETHSETFCTLVALFILTAALLHQPVKRERPSFSGLPVRLPVRHESPTPTTY